MNACSRHWPKACRIAPEWRWDSTVWSRWRSGAPRLADAMAFTIDNA